jgi:Ca-activated chloride channel family protein
MSAWTTFRFSYPFALLLLVVPVSVALLPTFQKRKFIPALRYSDVRLVAGLPKGWRVQLRWLPDVLRWLVWALLVVGLARPQSGTQVDVIRGQGIDIVLALDISSSMASLDFEPQNRLEAAKDDIGNFIAGREFDRIGLVVFARSAFHQAPLTLDYDVLLQLLEQVELASDLRPVDGRRLDGTAIGLGLASAANMLRAGSAPSKVIILLTDGANNAGLSPEQAAEAVSTLGMRVYTIGMGRPGLVELPLPEGEVITVESDLNEPALQDIAETTNGLYFRAENAEGLQEIYDQIDRLERSDAERRIFTRWRDRAPIILLLAFIVLVSEQLLRMTVFRRIP